MPVSPVPRRLVTTLGMITTNPCCIAELLTISFQLGSYGAVSIVDVYCQDPIRDSANPVVSWPAESRLGTWRDWGRNSFLSVAKPSSAQLSPLADQRRA